MGFPAGSAIAIPAGLARLSWLTAADRRPVSDGHQQRRRYGQYQSDACGYAPDMKAEALTEQNRHIVELVQ